MTKLHHRIGLDQGTVDRRMRPSLSLSASEEHYLRQRSPKFCSFVLTTFVKAQCRANLEISSKKREESQMHVHCLMEYASRSWRIWVSLRGFWVKSIFGWNESQMTWSRRRSPIFTRGFAHDHRLKIRGRGKAPVIRNVVYTQSTPSIATNSM